MGLRSLLPRGKTNKKVLFQLIKEAKGNNATSTDDDDGEAVTINSMGGSPGLVVMGGDSCSKGCGFKSWHCILDGHYSHIFVVKIEMMFA